VVLRAERKRDVNLIQMLGLSNFWGL